MNVNLISLDSVLQYLNSGYKIIGKSSGVYFSSLKPVFEADSESISWINPARKDKQQLYNHCKASIVICDNSIDVKTNDNIKCVIIDMNPRLAFTRILNNVFYHDLGYCEFGKTHPTAIISPEAKIGDSVTIGPFSVIGRCVIGDNVYIGAHNVIQDNVFIGNNVRINEFNLIGGAGLGFVREEDGTLLKMVHIGKLIIEDDVEIFTHVNVDRGTLSSTVIKRGAKIDHHVHLGHNISVGEDSIIVAHTVMCGGSQVGARSWIGVGSILKDAIKVGDDVMIGLGSVVTKNVPDGAIWIGNPARPMEEFVSQLKRIKSI